jgi:hypothetical protein
VKENVERVIVGKGEVVGFLGPNGAGKTTTMRIITAFMPATSGTVRVAGNDVAKDSLAARRNIGYVPEGMPLYPEMRVCEYLDYRARLKGVSPADQERLLQRAIQEQAVRGNTIAVSRLTSLAQVLNVAVPIAGATPGAAIPLPTTGAVTRTLGTPTPAAQPAFDLGVLIAIFLIVAALVLIAAIVVIFVLRVLPTLRSRRAARAPVSAAPAAATTMLEGERPQHPPIPSPPATTTPGG